MASTPRYEAFISYAHHDRVWAKWLHRALETYRVPSRLVGTSGATARTDRRLRPIFRDREEMPASGDLGHTVQAALADSGALIVICSPAAAASRWVNEEILAFKRLHGEQRIFCAIVAGEPPAIDASDDAPGNSCFPRALLHALQADGEAGTAIIEPLAADLRQQGDGRRLGKLKLIAGLLELPLDALVQREAQRRLRRMAWIVFAAVLGMLLMGGMALLAMRERVAAELQRSQAEGMVEFMIGDLRKKLEPMGRLDVLDAVGDRALEYYASQNMHGLDADSLGRRARVLHLIGELRDLRGNLDAAYQEFEQAAQSTKQLLDRQPDDTQRIYDHAQSVFWVGYIAWQRGKFATALAYFSQYEALAKRLVAADPGNRDWQMELAWARRNTGAVDLAADQVDAAALHFQQALAITTALADSKPDDDAAQLEQAQSLAWMADADARRGHWASVTDNRVAERTIYENLLVKDPKDQSVRQSLPVTERALAEAALAQGYALASEAHLATAEEFCAQLRATEPDNTFWKELSMTSAVNLAETLLWEDRLDRAREALARAADWGAQLTRSDPAFLSWQRLNLQRQLLQARWQYQSGAIAPANQSVAGLVGAIDQVLEHHRDDRALRTLQMQSLALAGRIAQARKDAVAARAFGQRLLVLAAGNDPEPKRQLLYAEALDLVGRAGDARSLAEALWQQGYQHPQLQRLRERLAAHP